MNLDGAKPSRAVIDRINRERVYPLAIYAEHGAEDRFGYLEQLAEAHGINIDVVIAMADVLGGEEDFDGLATALEDAQLGIGMGGAMWGEVSG